MEESLNYRYFYLNGGRAAVTRHLFLRALSVEIENCCSARAAALEKHLTYYKVSWEVGPETALAVSPASLAVHRAHLSSSNARDGLIE